MKTDKAAKKDESGNEAEPNIRKKAGDKGMFDALLKQAVPPAEDPPEDETSDQESPESYA